MELVTKTASPAALDGERVDALRAFTRFYTNIIGVLEEGLLKTPYSLTEARVIFELAQRTETEVADLRRSLDVDAGYLSRILSRFESDRLIAKDRSPADGRRSVITLTRTGRKVFELLNQRSAEENQRLISRLSDEDQRRLLGAMGVIRELLEGAPRSSAVVLRPFAPGDYGWVVQRHGVLYAEEYGWDETFEALVARIVADYVDHRDPRRENAWIAEVDGEPVGCIFCVKKTDPVAQLRLLLVDPRARGAGIGARLVDECMRFARRAGYAEMMLWTNDVLTSARRIYERAGFKLVEEERHHNFGHDLVGQNWSVVL
ncbi:MAG TPA: bifunctional helix-turn-helix transcriptional regulator/GNAT family N-acetyltransferase [Candidatus Dormibacteraeota bacterium]|nr:bifunctional helix-turn-helix transcriptional regulator/GNAT family N-acetyltransferase [Candidatus Dormibacteraeota bacterium]